MRSTGISSHAVASGSTSGYSSITVTYDTYGHLFSQAEMDLELFEKMEQDLMAA